MVSKPALSQNVVFLGDFLPASSASPRRASSSSFHPLSRKPGLSTVTKVVAGAPALMSQSQVEVSKGQGAGLARSGTMYT